MNIETLVTILVISGIAALLARVISGWTLSGLLASFLLACFGALGGWFAQQQLGLPALYSFPFPSGGELVPVVWPGLAALLAALAGGLFWRPGRPARPQRRSRR